MNASREYRSRWSARTLVPGLVVLAALGCQAEAQTGWAGPVPPSAGAASLERCRADLLETLASYRDIAGKDASRGRVDQAVGLVAGMAPGDLEPLGAACAQVGQWKRAAYEARSLVLRARSVSRAAYGVASAGDLPGAPYSGLCGSDRSVTEVIFGVQAALQAARGVWSLASRGCEQVVVVCPAPGGGNSSLACTFADTALFVAEAALEDVKFCDEDIDSAEIRGTYDRVAQVHDEIVLLDGKIDVIDGKLNALAQAVESLRLLGCDAVRLETTPEGRRASDIEVCSDRPEYPYGWPER